MVAEKETLVDLLGQGLHCTHGPKVSILLGDMSGQALRTPSGGLSVLSQGPGEQPTSVPGGPAPLHSSPGLSPPSARSSHPPL